MGLHARHLALLVRHFALLTRRQVQAPPSPSLSRSNVPSNGHLRRALTARGHRGFSRRTKLSPFPPSRCARTAPPAPHAGGPPLDRIRPSWRPKASSLILPRALELLIAPQRLLQQLPLPFSPSGRRLGQRQPLWLRARPAPEKTSPALAARDTPLRCATPRGSRASPPSTC